MTSVSQHPYKTRAIGWLLVSRAVIASSFFLQLRHQQQQHLSPTRRIAFGHRNLLRQETLVRRAEAEERWQELADSDGRIYYWDEISGRTQWEEPASLRAAARKNADSTDEGGAQLSLDDERLYQVSLPPSTGIQWGGDLELRWPRVLGFDAGAARASAAAVSP